MYEALDVVSRELTGYIAGVNRSSDVSRAAVGQSVIVPIANAPTSADNTPGVTAPDSGDSVVDNIPVAITKSKFWPVRWSGEETMGLKNAGTFSSIQADRFYNAMRAAVNEIEADIHAEAYKNASRGYGTAGTTPFATAGDMTDFAGVLRILEENGAPRGDLQLVLGHAAVGNLRGKQSGLFKVNEAGSADMLRNGMTDRIMNMAIRHSDVISAHTKGTGTGYLINNGSDEAVGQTSLTVDTGTAGATGIVAGDVITIAGDSNKYIVATGQSGAAGELVISKPGLLVQADNNDAITVGNSYTPNVAFSRSSIVLATRAPAMPEGGDSAEAVEMVVDDRTGLAFEIALYRQFHQIVYHVRLAWGTKAIKPEHIATLIG